MRHALLGMTREQAIKLVAWGNNGLLVIYDRSEPDRKKQRSTHGIGDFTCAVELRNNRVVKVRGEGRTMAKKIESEEAA